MAISNPSIDAFFRTFKELHSKLIQSFYAMIDLFSSNNHRAKVDAAQLTLEALANLESILSQQDRPDWIGQLRAPLREIVMNPSHESLPAQKIRHIIKFGAVIEDERWNFLNVPKGDPIQFDDIYDEYYKASKIPDLFDRMMTDLREILGTGLIDSRSAHEAIERLIATIEKNSNGSFFATIQTKNFAGKLIKNMTWGGLSDLPIVGGILGGIQKTFDEIESEYEDVQSKINARLDERTKVVIPASIAEARQQRGLPKPESDVIDVEEISGK